MTKHPTLRKKEIKLILSGSSRLVRGKTAEARAAPPAEGNTAEERVVPPAVGKHRGRAGCSASSG